MANLMDPMNIKVNLKAVANTIKESDGNAAQRLEELSLAVGGGSNAASWTSCDIYQVIDPNNVITRYRNHRGTDDLLSWLEVFRNSLIFVPLVVTWLGVSQAVDKYNQLLNADRTQSVQPFLYLWQDGFGNRLPEILKLSWLALIDFGILITVTALTITVYVISNRVKLVREQEAEDLHSQLTHALSGAVLHLQTRNRPQPVNVTQLGQVTQQFDTAITKLLREVENLANRQKQDFQNFVNFKNALTNTMNDMSSSAKDMKNSADTLHQSVSTLLTPAQQLAAQQGQLLTSVQQAVSLFRKQIDAQDKVVAEQQKWGTELSHVLKTFEGGVDSIAQFTRDQTALVVAMKTEHQQLGKLANDTFIAMDSMKRAVAEINKCSTELRALNVNMDQIVRRIASGRPI